MKTALNATRLQCLRRSSGGPIASTSQRLRCGRHHLMSSRSESCGLLPARTVKPTGGWNSRYTRQPPSRGSGKSRGGQKRALIATSSTEDGWQCGPADRSRFELFARHPRRSLHGPATRYRQRSQQKTISAFCASPNLDWRHDTAYWAFSRTSRQDGAGSFSPVSVDDLSSTY